MTEDQKQKLKDALWAVADVLRGRMAADDYRDYILGFIFYKYLSEKLELFADKVLRQDNTKFRNIKEHTPKGKDYLDAVKQETTEELGFFLKPSELFFAIATRAKHVAGADDRNEGGDEVEATDANFILENLQDVFDHITESTRGADSQDDFDHLFEDVDLESSKLGKSPNARNFVICKVINRLARIDFNLNDANSDVLGDAYEYLIGEFASGAGKKAGEFYTPAPVSAIIARIVTAEKRRLHSVYDPTCGSGSLLLRVVRELDVRDETHFFGQESNRTTRNLARMNMILHGAPYHMFDIQLDDTLEDPAHEGRRFEAVVANPPFSAQWSASERFHGDRRFEGYGTLPPRNKADYAFVLHMLYHLDENGCMAVLLPHGALFRGGSEGVIRKHLIEQKNWLDAIIDLPANLFSNTSIPACILVFKKCRKDPDNVLFIDASDGFIKQGNKNRLLDEHIDNIIKTYKARKPVKRYAAQISRDTLAENNYNLNIPRYVDKTVSEEPVDLKAVAEELAKIEKSTTKKDKKIHDYCNQLGIRSPV